MIRIAKKIINPLIIGWGRTPVKWVWKKPRDATEHINILISQTIHPLWQSKFRKSTIRLIYLYMLVIWPVRAILLTIHNSRKFGSQVKKLYGIGVLAQISHQLEMGLLHNASPEFYYLYELFVADRRKDARYYFSGSKASVLFALLNEFRSNSLIEDKLNFEQILRQEKFPVPGTIATIYDGNIEFLEPHGGEFPYRDFIVKPNNGQQGESVYLFEYLGNNSWQGSNSIEYNENSLKEFLSKISINRLYLIQPRLVNHPNVAELTSKGFSTIRIVTGIDTSGYVECITAVFKMPVGSGIADNYAAGGIAASVDLKTGMLGKAVSKVILSDRIVNHPDSGAKILGQVLPYWDEVVQLATNAHKCFVDYVFLGWDIGVTDAGPVILETNLLWDVVLMQRPHMLPLGKGKFMEICADHLDS